MRLQRTRRPRLRAGRSLRSLGSPLKRSPLGSPSRAILALLLVLPAAAVASGRAPADQIPVALTGTFSNMEYHDDIGDVSGIEIILVRGVEGKIFALFQMWEGGPDADPAFVAVRIRGDVVEFDLPKEWNCFRHFRGRIAAQALTGVFSGGSGCEDFKVALKRRHS